MYNHHYSPVKRWFYHPLKYACVAAILHAPQPWGPLHGFHPASLLLWRSHSSAVLCLWLLSLSTVFSWLTHISSIECTTRYHFLYPLFSRWASELWFFLTVTDNAVVSIGTIYGVDVFSSPVLQSPRMEWQSHTAALLYLLVCSWEEVSLWSQATTPTSPSSSWGWKAYTTAPELEFHLGETGQLLVPQSGWVQAALFVFHFLPCSCQHTLSSALFMLPMLVDLENLLIVVWICISLMIFSVLVDHFVCSVKVYLNP